VFRRRFFRRRAPRRGKIAPRNVSSRSAIPWPWDQKSAARLWNIFNYSHFHSRLVTQGESIRVFPLSPLDRARRLALHSTWKRSDVSSYFAREPTVVSSQHFYRVIDHTRAAPARGANAAAEVAADVPRMRFPCTGAILSDAGTCPQIIQKLFSFPCRSDAKIAPSTTIEGSLMELKKREGYF